MDMRAVVDRFEADKAVILVGEEEEVLVVDRGKLPPGVKEGDWLTVDIQDDVLLASQLDPEETANAKARIQDKLAVLRRGDHLKK
jgi:hypothetical protein